MKIKEDISLSENIHDLVNDYFQMPMIIVTIIVTILLVFTILTVDGKITNESISKFGKKRIASCILLSVVTMSAVLLVLSCFDLMSNKVKIEEGSKAKIKNIDLTNDDEYLKLKVKNNENETYYLNVDSHKFNGKIEENDTIKFKKDIITRKDGSYTINLAGEDSSFKITNQK